MYTDIPVIKIAMNNGFASVAAFNKVFKETYQETPSAYRKKKKETVDNQESIFRSIYCNKVKMIKSLMYDINKKFSIYHTWGIFNVYCF